MANTVSRIISDQTLNRIIQIESAGKPTVKAPKSSATGLGQFINATWHDTVEKHRPDVYEGRTRAQVLALRKSNTSFHIEMLARFTEDNARALGPGWQDGDLYLAHFLGVGAAKKVLRAPQSASVESYVSADAVKANGSILRGKTCGQVRAWAQDAMVNKWNRAGKPNWIAKYYDPSDPLVSLVPPTDMSSAKRRPASDLETPYARPTPTRAAPDEKLRKVQAGLTKLRYTLGKTDGLWGGMTAGAIAGFANDRHLDIVLPKSWPQYLEIEDELVAELNRVEPDWTRPVSEERAKLDPRTVDELAPEARPVGRNFLVTAWGAVVSAVGAVFTAVSDKLSEAWSFFADEDGLRPGVIGTIASLPGWVWFVVVAALLGYVSYNSVSAYRRISEQIKTGERT